MYVYVSMCAHLWAHFVGGFMVDKRIHIYIRNEEILKKIKSEESKSEIISMLLEEYYSQDLEYLKQKKQELTQEKEIIELKISNKEKQNELIESQRKEEKEKSKEIEQKKEFNKILFGLFKSKKITEKIYFKICDMKDMKNKKKELKKSVTLKRQESFKKKQCLKVTGNKQ